MSEKVETQNLGVLSYANGMTVWSYKADSLEFMKPGYFDSEAQLFREGDEFIVSVRSVIGTDRYTGHLHHFDEHLVPAFYWERRSPTPRG